MGSDLQLTGLASGFDWKPVVEQLIELEAIPKARLHLVALQRPATNNGAQRAENA